jgi:hypothetical protein
MILHLMANCPIVSTDNVARYFLDRGSPSKRASEHLNFLLSERLIDGHSRALQKGKSKVWRLSKKGREKMNVTSRAIPLNSNKVDHYVSIANLYQDLKRRGELRKWIVELREDCGKSKYCPDAFAAIKTENGTRAYLFELQLSPLPSTRWAEKWTIAQTFFENPDYLKAASFQFVEGRIIKPNIIVLSSQQPETVRGETRIQITIAKDLKQVVL